MRKLFWITSVTLVSLCLGACRQILQEPLQPTTGSTTNTISSALSSVARSSLAGSEQSYIGPFHKTENGDFVGTLTLQGYPIREKVCDEGGYGDPCTKWTTYVFFRITDGIIPPLREFIEQNKGNSFMRSDAVGLGCERSKEIKTILPMLDSSSPSSPATIVLNRPFEVSGGGVDSCYSHFVIVRVSH